MSALAVRVIAILAASLSLAACAPLMSTANPRVTPEPPMFASFFVLDGASSGDAAFNRQLQESVEVTLTEKGLIRTAPEEAQAVVVVHTTTPARHTRRSLYEGWGGWDWHDTTGGQLGDADYYKPGTLVVDIFDAWSKQLLWHRAVGMDASAKRAISAVRRLFKNFPDSGYQSPAANLLPTWTSRGDLRIIFSSRPTLLVRIDGEPRYAAIGGSDLERVVNTTADLMRSSSGLYYLRVGGDWMESDDLFGSWSRAGVPPDHSERLVDLVAPYDAAHEMPVVYISTTPAKLVVTDGAPEYVAVNGTRLLYLKNTQATVFREPTDHQLYVHVSEGWFRAWSPDGPWQHISETQLPADLAWIRPAAGVDARLTAQ